MANLLSFFFSPLYLAFVRPNWHLMTLKGCSTFALILAFMPSALSFLSWSGAFQGFSPGLFFVALGASMIVASINVPSLTLTPASVSQALTSSTIWRARLWRSSKCLKFMMVVWSGIGLFNWKQPHGGYLIQSIPSLDYSSYTIAEYNGYGASLVEGKVGDHYLLLDSEPQW